jgi:hypothetical protein
MANKILDGERLRGRVYAPRRTLPPDVALALRMALDESHLSYRAAAHEIGISHSYLFALTRGTRCPRRRTAEAIIVVLPLDAEAEMALLEESVDD